ncbi:ATP-binding cassette domain-containing protein, partial [uncultured Desulfovibrio sp.]
VLSPSSGQIEINGSIAALLELGAGFNTELTGRENVRFLAPMLGIMPEKADDFLQKISAFAELGDFIDQPVKLYSSGMFARLAFAMNISSQPDILIVDEALAVG